MFFRDLPSFNLKFGNRAKKIFVAFGGMKDIRVQFKMVEVMKYRL